jgi:hypothetical protein
MNTRRSLPVLALAVAACYAAMGVMELTHTQPTTFKDPIDYLIELAFVAGLLGSAATLALSARACSTSKVSLVAWGAAAAGHSGLLVAAATTAIRGTDSLDSLFVVGFLLIVSGYITLAVLDLRKRLTPSRAGLVLVAGFVGSVFVDSFGAGGFVLAASWAGLSRTLSPAAVDEPLQRVG